MWNIQTFDSLPSTQTLARERLSSGAAKHGDVFIALHQTEGRGRYDDRIWHDEPGANLLMSIVLTDIPDHLKNKMQFVAALSVLMSLRPLLHVEFNFDYDKVRLKWINDILINEKKVAGVMTEAIWSGNTLMGIVIGIGINVNQLLFPPDIADRAISLKHVTHQILPIEMMGDLMLDALGVCIESYHSSEFLMTDLRRELEWMRLIENFSLTEPNGTKAEGLRYDGITDDGALRVTRSDGSEQIYHNATLVIT